MQAGGELVHVISFLLQMGFREVGVPFPLEGLNPLQANIAAQLSQLGLLMPFRCPFVLPHALQVPLHSASVPFKCPSSCLVTFCWQQWAPVQRHVQPLSISLSLPILIAKGPWLWASAPHGSEREKKRIQLSASVA